METTASLGLDQAREVLRQVEFYFSDSNLPRDKFLSKTVKESEDGFVSLALICSFSRMKKHLGLDNVKPEEVPEPMIQAVAETLRKSSLLKVSEDGKRVGRSTELLKPEEVIEQVDSRTVAVSPLQHDVRLEDVELFFSKFGKVNSVRLPRHIADKKHFCGTALVEFSEEEVIRKVLKEMLVYAGTELEIKPKKDFDAEISTLRAALENSHSNNNDHHENGNYPKGLILAFKIKNALGQAPMEPSGSVKDSNQQNTVESVDEKLEAVSEENVEKAVKEKNQQNTVELVDEKHDTVSEENVKNLAQNLVGEDEDPRADKEENKSEDKVQNRRTSENLLTREDLKEAFQRFGTVKFVDYKMGDESGYIRFENSDAAIKARATVALVAAGGLVVKNYLAILDAVTGDAEKEYWDALRGGQDRFKEKQSSRGRGRNRKLGKHLDGKRTRQEEDGNNNRQHKIRKIAV